MLLIIYLLHTIMCCHWAESRHVHQTVIRKEPNVSTINTALLHNHSQPVTTPVTIMAIMSTEALNTESLTESISIEPTDDNAIRGPVFHESAVVQDELHKIHKLNIFSLLIFVFLLTVTMLIIWQTKKHHCKFVHETGLTILLGLVIGAAIHYGAPKLEPTVETVMIAQPNNFTMNLNGTNSSTLVVAPLKHNETSSTSAPYSTAFIGTLTDAKDVSLQQVQTLNPELFFNLLLPPIIFNAGYNMDRKYFFRSIGAILVFVVFGTAISAFIVGFVSYGFSQLFDMTLTMKHCLYFGALISCTDPIAVLNIFLELKVDVDLFALVFGESSLNDAVGLVLAETIDSHHDGANTTASGALDGVSLAKSIGRFLYMFPGSMIIGIVIGFFNALLTKFSDLSHSPSLETSIFLLLSYASYLVAEAVEMTGVVSVLLCGVCQAHYSYRNMSTESKRRTSEFFELIGFLAENFVFGYIGVSLFTSNIQKFEPRFIAASFVSILVGRAVAVHFLSTLLNLFRKPKIPFNFQLMMTFAGLRGAVALGIAIRNTSTDEGRIIYTTTSVIVLVTVLVNGGLTEAMIGWLKITHGNDGSEAAVASDPVMVPEDKPGSISVANQNQRPAYIRSASIESQFSVCSSTGLEDDDQHFSKQDSHSSPDGKHVWKNTAFALKWYRIDKRYLRPLLTHSQPSLLDTVPEFMLKLARFFTSEKQQWDRKRYLYHKSLRDSQMVKGGDIFGGFMGCRGPDNLRRITEHHTEDDENMEEDATIEPGYDYFEENQVTITSTSELGFENLQDFAPELYQISRTGINGGRTGSGYAAVEVNGTLTYDAGVKDNGLRL